MLTDASFVLESTDGEDHLLQVFTPRTDRETREIVFACPEKLRVETLLEV